MDPLTAAILIGTAAASMYSANQSAKAQARAQKQAQDTAVENQNKLIEEGYKKKKQAMGLGQEPKTGMVASQSGGVLTSVNDGNQASGL